MKKKKKKYKGNPEIVCYFCGWHGKTKSLVDFVVCPFCKEAEYIRDIVEEPDAPLWKYHKDDFAWNKK